MFDYLWNDGALFVGRSLYFALALRLAMAIAGIDAADVNAWLTSIGA